MATSAKKNQLSSFDRGVPYSKARSRFYNRFGTSELVMQHEYQNIDYSAIKVVLDFYSDKGTWESSHESRHGDFDINNIIDNSLMKRYESLNPDTSFIINYIPSDEQLNGFFPLVFFFGNHNLTENDQIIIEAFDDDSYSNLAYTINVKPTIKNTFAINYRTQVKKAFYKITINTHESKVLKIGRIVLGSSLPTNYQNNIQSSYTKGYNHYKDEIETEYLNINTNTIYFGKKLDFAIKIKQDDELRVNDRIQDLIKKGNGNTVFIVIPDTKNPNHESIYGILKDASEFNQEIMGWGTYNFAIEEIE